MLNQLLSNRVIKTPSTEVSTDRYEFLTLSEAEPDLGVPSSNGYILASTATGTRSWLNPATALLAPGTTTQVIFNNAGTLSAASGLVYDNITGNVGIGTTSPSTALHIASETFNNHLTITRSNIGVSHTQSGNIASIGIVGSTTQFQIFSTNLVVDNANSRVGVGTTTPTQRLDVIGNATLRNSTTATNLTIHNTYTDASNYERAVVGWTGNVLQIGTEALGTGTRRAINLNYTTTIDGGARTNVAALTLTNLGAGNGGLVVGSLNVGHAQDQTRVTGFDIANKALSYSVRGSAVASQGAHRFSGDSNTGTSVGATGSILDILAPATATNIFQCRQADGTVTLNVAYNGALTIANTVSQSVEATTLATVTKTQIASFPVASFRSGKLVVQSYDSVTGEVQISELLVAHNGTVASATEYGVVFTGANSLVLYDVDISAGNVRLMATRTTANSTQYKISETLMVA